MFWKFLLSLGLMSVVFPFVFVALYLPVMRLGVRDVSLHEHGHRRFSHSRLRVMFVTATYIVCGWAAFVSSFVLFASSRPEVAHKLAYYVTGWFGCMSPLWYMSSKDRKADRSSIDHDGTLRANALQMLIATASYAVFSVWPGLMQLPYGWFLRWWWWNSA